MKGLRFHPDSAAQQQALGARLAAACPPGTVVHLAGDLGAGKTTLVRGFLRGCGFEGTVRSPTYTLVEPYFLERGDVYHLDLYRLGDPEELDYLGLREMLSGRATLLIEWPERGAGWLPDPDLNVEITHRADGRDLVLSAGSEAGAGILLRLRV